MSAVSSIAGCILAGGQSRRMGLRSARQWVTLHDAGIAEWSTEPYDPFFNINRPEDAAKAEQILREFAP